MSRFTSHRAVSRAATAIVAYPLAVMAVFSVIAVVVTSAPSTRAPLDAVVRLEGLGCKRNPTRSVGTVVTEPLANGGQLVLTVAHGVVGQRDVDLVAGSLRVPLRLIAVDTEWDLAVLQAAVPLPSNDGTPVGGVRFAEGRVGNATFVAFQDASDGFQDATVRAAHIKRRLRVRTEDIYLRKLDDREARPGLEVRVEATVGDSGGPLFDPNGDMIGVIWGTSRTSSGRSWATRVQASSALIETARQTLQDDANATLESLRLLACAP